MEHYLREEEVSIKREFARMVNGLGIRATEKDVGVFPLILPGLAKHYSCFCKVPSGEEVEGFATTLPRLQDETVDACIEIEKDGRGVYLNRYQRSLKLRRV